ncbi:YHYH domain-containing protein [Paenibacillus harenae]|uniref:Copper amine oxidase-like N-terminal domain-containing protein n=1 Tax=Paenibacillus harenae TaxID=306543 RepID=A0ABT9U589_PAEHA|nr:YHYH domain-containing protein [Paenibacillus harenae]MDQ0113845.1 hypothetical protein [Paenibacillus harenae]
MKKLVSIILLSVMLVSMIMPTIALAHSGRTDSSGGHNCSDKSKAKGLCTGYHYHNGGSSSSESSSSNTTTQITKVKVISNEYPEAPHCKKIKDVYVSTDTYYIYYERIWDCNYYTNSGTVYTYLDLNLFVDTKQQVLNKQLISVKYSTYISVRDFSKAAGYSLEIDKAGDVVLKKEKSTIKIVKSNSNVLLNGKATDVTAEIADSTYYIPLRSALKWVNGSISSLDSYNLYISIAN